MSEFDAIGMMDATLTMEEMANLGYIDKWIRWLRSDGFIVASDLDEAAEILRKRGYAVISPRDMESFRYIGGSCPVCGGGQ